MGKVEDDYPSNKTYISIFNDVKFGISYHYYNDYNFWVGEDRWSGTLHLDKLGKLFQTIESERTNLDKELYTFYDVIKEDKC